MVGPETKWRIERRLPIGEDCSLQLLREEGTLEILGCYRDDEVGEMVPGSVRRFGTNTKAAVAWYDGEKAKVLAHA